MEGPDPVSTRLIASFFLPSYLFSIVSNFPELARTAFLNNRDLAPDMLEILSIAAVVIYTTDSLLQKPCRRTTVPEVYMGKELQSANAWISTGLSPPAGRLTAVV